jgi:lipopolysaccharide transport system permease protein
VPQLVWPTAIRIFMVFTRKAALSLPPFGRVSPAVRRRGGLTYRLTGLWNARFSSGPSAAYPPTHMNSLWLRIRPYLSNFVRYMHISYLEAKSGYEGTVLGIMWIPVSTLAFSLLLGFVFHASDTIPPTEFFLYVLSGFVTWNFISDSISRSTNIIQSKFDFAIHNNLGLAGLYGKMLADRGFEFGLEFLLLVVAVLLLAPWNYGPQILLLALLLPMLAVVSLSMSYLVNLLTLFYPDLGNMVSTVVRLMFFATPIFWKVEDRVTDMRVLLETYNPASYYLMMMRQAFGIEPFNVQTWLIGAIISAIVAVAGMYAYRQSSSFVRNLR